VDLIAVGLIVMLGVAVATDVGMRKIPNLVTVGGFGFALFVRGLAGAGPLVEGLLGAALGFALFVPIWMIGGIGGGDAKLLTATGAFLGLELPLFGVPLAEQRFFIAILATAIIGAIIALIAAARRRALTSTLLGTKDLALGVVQRAVGSPVKTDLPSLDKPGGVRNPYGVAIAAGGLIGLLYG